MRTKKPKRETLCRLKDRSSLRSTLRKPLIPISYNTTRKTASRIFTKLNIFQTGSPNRRIPPRMTAAGFSATVYAVCHKAMHNANAKANLYRSPRNADVNPKPKPQVCARCGAEILK
jgi:hypothetical protein